jgi:hypothetical protein
MFISQTGNYRDTDQDTNHDGYAMTASSFQGTFTTLATAVPMEAVTTVTANQAYDNVLAQAGAFYWDRDSVDTRLVGHVTSRTGGTINSQDEVGGYPVIETLARPTGWDTDNDGMPGYWEAWYGTGPDAGDQNGISASGYTHLERYLEWLLNPTSIIPHFHMGDANVDGLVDVGDLGVLAFNWNQPAAYAGGDFTGDGFVDVGDLGVLAFNWNWTYLNQPVPPESVAALASVPEPATLCALAVGAFVIWRRRR